MKIRIGLLIFAFLATCASAPAQHAYKRGGKDGVISKQLVANYADSLQQVRHRLDSLKVESGDSRYAQLFTPLTFYHAPANQLLRLNPQQEATDSLGTMLDRTLINIYLKRPDLVRDTETHLREVGAPLATQGKPKKNHTDIVKEVAPKAIEPDAVPMDIVITRPNFWTIGGDYYL